MAELTDSAQLDDSVQSFTVSVERDDLVADWGDWAANLPETTEATEAEQVD